MKFIRFLFAFATVFVYKVFCNTIESDNPASASSESAQQNDTDSCQKTAKKNKSSRRVELDSASGYDRLDIERKEAAEEVAKARKRYQDGYIAAKHTLQAAESEECDWRTNFFDILKGEVCGRHYKVLGLDKHADNVAIKKAYRAKSLDVHPDKNPAKTSQEAFRVVQEAYECLTSKLCREDFDGKLASAESLIRGWRQRQVDRIRVMALRTAMHAYLYMSIGAEMIANASALVWTLVGHVAVSNVPVGQLGLLALLGWKGRRVLLVQVLSLAVSRFNREIVRRSNESL